MSTRAVFQYLSLLLTASAVSASINLPHLSSYADGFVDPDYILAADFNITTSAARNTILAWATFLTPGGPWSVVNKSAVPPSGDKHDYMSWQPYSWPNCTGVGNSTVLTDPEIWAKCPYYTRHGFLNPDYSYEDNDIGAFSQLADAVLYNSLAWALSDFSRAYASNAVGFIKTWFIDADTRMNPNLKYAQMRRGPNGQLGEPIGILDLRGMTKIVSGILILRKGNSTDWTSQLDEDMIAWTTQYITWLELYPTAIQESQALDYHSSFYYSQLASLKILVNDLVGARNVTQTYFNNPFMAQIAANGEQPFEASKAMPDQSRAFNLAAMIANARLASYANYHAWNQTTTSGSTIQTSLDYAMTTSSRTDDPSANNNDPTPSPPLALLLSDVAAIAAVYSDPSGKYAAFLEEEDPDYPEMPYFLWDQPLSDSGFMRRTVTGHGGSGGGGYSSDAPGPLPTLTSTNGAVAWASRGSSGSCWGLGLWRLVVVAVVVVVAFQVGAMVFLGVILEHST